MSILSEDSWIPTAYSKNSREAMLLNKLRSRLLKYFLRFFFHYSTYKCMYQLSDVIVLKDHGHV